MACWKRPEQSSAPKKVQAIINFFGTDRAPVRRFDYRKIRSAKLMP
jgi:hypothetical protein